MKKSIVSIQKNGLSSDQVNNARAILKQVNVARICEDKGVKVSTIYNVLRDESPRVEDLAIVITEAKKEMAKKAKARKVIPV